MRTASISEGGSFASGTEQEWWNTSFQKSARWRRNSQSMWRREKSCSCRRWSRLPTKWLRFSWRSMRRKAAPSCLSGYAPGRTPLTGRQKSMYSVFPAAWGISSIWKTSQMTSLSMISASVWPNRFAGDCRRRGFASCGRQRPSALR
ncbi:hypothetical protein SDC9_61698 [bioreactor metagenome]|uniref:Uncharacterized protein n=1 Tax=bioreactor metagenome TaxID=1076179 RepID=A0A644XGF9_9ZZZZ